MNSQGILASKLDTHRIRGGLRAVAEKHGVRFGALLENAKAEAERFKDEFIGAEHLLIAMTQESQGDVPQILKEFEVDQG